MKETERKIVNWEQLNQLLHRWRLRGERIVFTNGCFDLLHSGHLKVLHEAIALGDRLIIGLNADVSVRKLKGEDRPVKPETERALCLAAMWMVDAVILFENETPMELIRKIQPDVLVKGGDYTRDQIVGADTVITNGGELHIIPLKEGRSTSAILRQFGM
jgi:D-beta-D-heptose 7-phosphate kinase/D-beta-D-heptose 1-phosphate adenosyltransferase